MRRLVILACLVMATSPLHGTEKKRCLDLVASRTRVTLHGELAVRLYPVLPIFDGPDTREAEKPALILLLPERTCANDGLLIDATTDFQEVEVRTEKPRFARALDGLVGRHLVIHGEALGARNRHDKAPLVVYVDALDEQP